MFLRTVPTMTTRTYHCSLNATITVDDETVQSAMLGFGLREGLDGPPVEDTELVFTAQQEMLASFQHIPPDRLLQMFLVNGYLVPAELALRSHLMQRLPGAEVRLDGIDVVHEPLSS